MTLHPFSDTLSVQLASLERGMALLAAFSDRYGDMKPMAVSPILPACYFPSTAAAEVAERMGRDGWTVEASMAWKEIEGVRVELQLPRIQPKPFTL